MKSTTQTKTAKSAYVKDKHLATLPEPIYREVGPIVMTPDEMNAWDRMEEYFNTKAEQGLQMVHAGPIRWGFAPCKPGEYIYRVVTLEQPYYYPASQDYLKFLVDSGVEIVFVGGNGTYAIVRRPAVEGSFEITGTVSSKLAYLRILNNRIVALLWVAYLVLILYTVTGVANMWSPRPPDPILASMMTGGMLITLIPAILAHVLLRRNDNRLLALIAESAVHE